jgi:ADP-ribosylglycohydrolase/catechol 2,3-dioxygenase-like lactoylglutathione lyase family enzyme
VIQAGEYSDDTQLTLAVARCRILSASTWWAAFTRTEVPLWTLYERGGGGATKRAAESWIKGNAPWKEEDRAFVRRYFEAGGNGVSMRVLPHAIFYAGQEDPKTLLNDVVSDGVATHGHPRALLGATAYAFAAWWLARARQTVRFGELVDALLDKAAVWGALPAAADTRNGWFDEANRNTESGYEHLWFHVLEEMKKLLDRVHHGLQAGAIADDEEVLRDIGCYGREKGSGSISTAAAVYLCARYAAQPVQGVLRAAFATGIDTDTIAAMTGGLMGCLAGSQWLPREWFSVQDCDYLRQIANRLAMGPGSAEEGPNQPRPLGLKDIRTIYETLQKDYRGELQLGGGRVARVIDFYTPRSQPRSTILQRWQMKTSDGQTLYITKFSRRAKDKATSEADVKLFGEPKAVKSAGRAMPTAAGIKLTVTDMKAVAEFYETVLGLRPLRRMPRFISFGAVSLVDAQYAHELTGGATSVSPGPGRHRVEVHVPDVEAVYADAQAAGIHLVKGIVVTPWGERSFHCLDPEGNLVEVIERR